MRFLKRLISSALAAVLLAGGVSSASAASDGFNTNLTGLKGLSGSWSITDSGYRGQGSGDCFAMSDTYASDFIYETDVTIQSGTAASIVFRSNAGGSEAYVANVDLAAGNARIFKFTGGGAVTLGTYSLPDRSVRDYHLRVEAFGDQLRYYLNGALAVSCTDSQFSDGRLGLLIYSSTSVFGNLNYSEITGNTPRITGLKLSDGKLSPDFDPDILTYSVALSETVKKITLDPTGSSGSRFSAVLYDGSGNISGEYSDCANIPLSPGTNRIALKCDNNNEKGLSVLINVKSGYYNETYRPQYHVTPETGWVNDPNGMVYYNGEYHLFYQHTVGSKYSGDKWWAHVVSTDMVHWEERPIALAPDMYGSMWSGSAIVDENNDSGLFSDTPDKQGLIAYYTVASSAQRQSMAYSKDGGNTWIKYNGGAPVIDVSEDPYKSPDFRDPKVFWHEESGQWMMIVAGGPVRFYSSSNLINWKLEGTRGDIHTECPDFFRLPVDGDENNQKWVLSGGGVWYMIGEFEQVDGVWNFVPDTGERLDFNLAPDHYATQSYYGTPDGRRIIISWMCDVGYCIETANVTDPWGGAGLTLPYELELVTVNGEIRLKQNPVKELESLRKEKYSFDGITVSPDTVNPLRDITLDKYEIEAVIDAKTANEFGFVLRAGNGQHTDIVYNSVTEMLTLDRSKSGANPVDRFASGYCSQIISDGKIKLHIYVDRSSVELFAQDGLYPFTGLIYPDCNSVGMEFYAKGGNVYIETLNIYTLESIYREETAPEETDGISLITADSRVEKGDSFTVWAVSDPVGYDFGDLDWSVSDSSVLKIEAEGFSAFFKAEKAGDCTVTATDKAGNSASVTVTVYESVFRTNLTGWSALGGSWQTTDRGLEGYGAGNSPIITSETAGDFIYEATFTYTSGDVGTALVFRMSEDKSVYYTADINESGRIARILKFNRKPDGSTTDVTLGQPYSLPLSDDRTYRMKVVAKGSALQFYINDILAVECEDSDSLSGHLGFNLCAAGGVFQDAFCTASAGLDGITLSDGELVPDFSSDKKEYTVKVAGNVKDLTVGLTPAPGNRVKVNGVDIADDTGYISLPLEISETLLEIEVAGEFDTAEKYILTVVRSFLPGDMDYNGTVNVADMLALKNLIMSGEYDKYALASGDLDENGTLNVSDMIAVKNIIMNGK